LNIGFWILDDVSHAASGWNSAVTIGLKIAKAW
jgi:hypothetical protein